MKKIALILCLVLVASFVLSGCNNSDSIITLEDREVGKIEIQSGNTGETVEVTEEEVISQIADILSLEFEKGEKSNDSTGWSYSVRWYDTEGKQIDTVVIMNDGTIEKDGYFWKTSKDNIELSVFDELVTKHSSELPLEWDKIPMVMVDGKLYYDTGKESTVSARCGVMDGEITSTVDGSEIPTKDNQSNFGTGFEYQYGADNTIEIFMNEKWIVFEQREGTGNQVRFGDRMVDADGLSEETLEWLDWYNSLPEEQQLAISAVPPDLLEESGLVKTEDAEVSAQEDEGGCQGTEPHGEPELVLLLPQHPGRRMKCSHASVLFSVSEISRLRERHLAGVIGVLRGPALLQGRAGPR